MLRGVEYYNNFCRIVFILMVLYVKMDIIDGDGMDSRWEKYKEKYNKTYHDSLEDLQRRRWEMNIKLIERHNKEAEEGHHTFKLKPNNLADMSRLQYINRMIRLVPLKRKKDGDPMLSSTYMETPNKVDWREEGFKTPPWNQRTCGSCYAFSVAAGIQGQIMKETGRLQMLSSQQIVDCSYVTGNNRCIGGSLRNTMDYVQRFGLMQAVNYTYQAKASRCLYLERAVVATISSWDAVPMNDEKALQVAVATMGPVAVSIDASPRTFHLYSSGIYNDPNCSSTDVNHAVLVVGYTEDYWIIKNWWGRTWGENGYMRLEKHKNRCGIAKYAVYAIL